MNNPTTLIGIQTLVLCVAIAALVWWQKKLHNSSEAARPARLPRAASDSIGNHVQALLRDAENKLKSSASVPGASLTTLPAVLVIGPAGAGKTTVVLHSGLNPELLAGDAYANPEVLPTRCLNIWLASQTIFIEVSAAVAADASAVQTVLKHLVPGQISTGMGRVQPPRGILLCIDQSTVGSAPARAEVTALARPWNQFHSVAAETLGVRLPAYVLFTKADAVAGFQEFFSNLNGKDLAQAVGATVRPFSPATQGAHAEDTSQVLTQHFLDIMHCLSNARLPLLIREPDHKRAALEYQFPREFNKLQKNVVQFLIEVARSRKPQMSPSFLRGFYFCGTRKVTGEPAGNVGATAPMPADMEISATRVMTAKDIAALKSGPPPAGRRERTEWLFLTTLFENIILRDCQAHRVSTGILRTGRVQAAALAIAAALGIALLVPATVSFIRNRALNRDLVSAGSALADSGSPVGIFSRLDRMRRPVEQLITWRSSPPLSMRWGLYQGEDLRVSAEAGYCAAIRNQILPPLLQALSSRLKAMRSGGTDHAADFGNLKAYMMMTTHPQRVEVTFLTRQLMEIWSEASGRVLPPEANQVLPAELRLYVAILSDPDVQEYCVNPPSPGLITASQRYLRTFNANDNYQSLLQLAGRDLEPVNYGTLFPNDAVGDGKIVPGWFTRPGWMKMQELLDRPADSLQADSWVLGESKDLTAQQLSLMAAALRMRYSEDYSKAWKEFLNSVRIMPYANLNDAATKLGKMAGQDSVLLNLIGLAAKHTASIDRFRAGFQPVSAMAPTAGGGQAGVGAYLDQLNSLKYRVYKATLSTGSAHEQDIAEVRKAASTAKDAVDRIALRTFKGDTDQIVKAILLKPIIQITPALDRDAAGDINAGGKDLCNVYDRLSGLLPFSRNAQRSASAEDIQGMFQPETGQMWKFYNKSLRDSLECFDTTCLVKTNPRAQLSRDFIEFFRRLNRWSRLLYAGTRDPLIRLQVRATTVNRLKQLEMVLGDSHVTLPAGGSEFQPIDWDPRRSQKLQVSGTFEAEPEGQDLYRGEGPWALFEWFNDTEPNTAGVDGFTWIPRTGRVNAALLKNGNTKRYKLDIRYGDGTARALDLRLLTIGPCFLPVAK